jgi:hypothetical protein
VAKAFGVPYERFGQVRYKLIKKSHFVYAHLGEFISFQGGKGRVVVDDPALFLAKQKDWRKIYFA